MFFLKFSCFLYDLTNVGNLISVSSALSKTNFNIWKFTVHIFLNPGLKNFPFVMIHRVKGFSIVNEAEVDVFLEFSCFFYDPTDAGNLISAGKNIINLISVLTIW